MLPDDDNQLEFDFNQPQEDSRMQVYWDPVKKKLFYQEEDEVAIEPKEWEVKESEEEFDLNQDGIIDESEENLRDEFLKIRNSDRSAWAKRKALKKLLRENGYDQDDLTITY